MATVPKEIEIESFKVGKHISANGESYEFSLADMEQMVASYKPDYPAPLVVGHPSSDAPAYGWIKSVKINGNKLIATVGDMVSDFVEWLENKHFRKVSLSLYKPDSPNNPSPGFWSIKHLGFLGGAPPAIKGLQPVSFTEVEGVISFEDSVSSEICVVDIFRAIREYFIAEKGLDMADKVISGDMLNRLNIAMKMDESTEEQKTNYLQKTIKYFQDELMNLSNRVSILESHEQEDEKEEMVTDMSEETNTQVDFSEMQAELNRQREELNQLAAIAKAERDQLLQERALIEQEKITNFVEGLVKNLQLAPAEKDNIAKLILATPDNLQVEFSEGSRSPRKQLMDFLQSRSPLVGTQEIATPEVETLNYSEDEDSLKLPPGYGFDPESLRIYNQAKEYQKRHPEMQFSEALSKVTRGGR